MLTTPTIDYPYEMSVNKVREFFNLGATGSETPLHAQRPPCRLCGQSVKGHSFVHDFNGVAHTACLKGKPLPVLVPKERFVKPKEIKQLVDYNERTANCEDCGKPITHGRYQVCRKCSAVRREARKRAVRGA